MRCILVVGLLAAGCERASQEPPAPKPVPPPPAPPAPRIEFPACTKPFPLEPPAAEPERPVWPDTHPGESISASFERWDKRERELDKLPLDMLLQKATKVEVGH